MSSAPGPVPVPGGAHRTAAALVCAAVAVALLSVLALLPVPFAIEAPGPAIDVLGSSGGTRLIEVSGARTYPTSGALDLTTVRVSGGPGARVDLPQVLVAWLRRDSAALPAEEIFPVGSTAASVRSDNAAELTTSTERATAAALTELGTPYTTTLVVAGLPPGSGAAGVLRAGDVITSVDGAAAADLGSLRAALRAGPPGRVVRVGVVRGGAAQRLAVTTGTGPDGGAVLGVLVDPRFRFPFHVGIQVDRIGGPSAGMMFALGVYDLLTPGALTGGRRVAGTGTIEATGEVGAIGGIASKMVGARDAGATLFLAPAANCSEVVGHVPEGLRVVRVATLHEARLAVQAVATGRGAALPGCG